MRQRHDVQRGHGGRIACALAVCYPRQGIMVAPLSPSCLLGWVTAYFLVQDLLDPVGGKGSGNKNENNNNSDNKHGNPGSLGLFPAGLH